MCGNGVDGTNGTSVTMTPEPPGANCPAGGERLQSGSSPAAYVCNGVAGVDGANGADGANGTDGQALLSHRKYPAPRVQAGGVAISVGSNAPTYVCSGPKGTTGTDGTNGQSVTMTLEPAGFNCTNGGQKLQVGAGPATYVCNGVAGGNGTNGTNGPTASWAKCVRDSCHIRGRMQRWRRRARRRIRHAHVRMQRSSRESWPERDDDPGPTGRPMPQCAVRCSKSAQPLRRMCATR